MSHDHARDAVDRIDADPHLPQDLGHIVDTRGTLTFMRDVLDNLIADPQTVG